MRRWLAFNVAVALLLAGLFLASLYGPPIPPDFGASASASVESQYAPIP